MDCIFSSLTDILFIHSVSTGGFAARVLILNPPMKDGFSMFQNIVKILVETLVTHMGPGFILCI